MPERVRLEDKLKKVQSDLEEASSSFEASVETLSSLLGSKDASRIMAAKESMQLWSDAVRTLSEQERVLQRRLVYLSTTDLTRSANKALKSSSRAAWATFFVTVFAMIAWTAAVFITTVAAR